MCLKSDANKGQHFNLSFESSSFIFNNVKTEKLKLIFEGWNRPVCNLFGFTRVSFCQNCISPSNSEANRDGADAESPVPLFFSFSASFKNSSPREKVENCLRFGTGGWSLCFYPLLSQNIWIFFPTLTMAARAKKNSGKAICSRHQRESAPSRFGARVRYWIWLRGSASYVIIRVLAAALVLSHALQQTTHITQFSKNEHFCQGISPQFLAPSWGLGQDIVLV